MCKGRGVPVEEIQSTFQPLFELAGLGVPPSLTSSSPQVQPQPAPEPVALAVAPLSESKASEPEASKSVTFSAEPTSSIVTPSSAPSPDPTPAATTSAAPPIADPTTPAADSVASPAPEPSSSAASPADAMHVDSPNPPPADTRDAAMDQDADPERPPDDDIRSSVSGKSDAETEPGDGPRPQPTTSARRGSMYVELPYVHIHYSDSSSSSSSSSPISSSLSPLSDSADGDYIPSDETRPAEPRGYGHRVVPAELECRLPPAPRCKNCTRAGVVCIPRRFRGRMCRDCQSRKVKCDFSDYTKATGVTYASPEAFMARYGDDVYRRIETPGELTYSMSLADRVEQLSLGRASPSPPPPEPQPAPPSPSQNGRGIDLSTASLIELSDDEVAILSDSGLASARPSAATVKVKAEPTGGKRKARESVGPAPTNLPNPRGVRSSRCCRSCSDVSSSLTRAPKTFISTSPLTLTTLPLTAIPLSPPFSRAGI